MIREEREVLERFGPRYRLADREPIRRLGRAVIGADYGASGYTTREEADQIGDLLGLGPGDLLLDLGAGRGWPGLYLSRTTGPTVVLADLPIEGLRAARDRADREALRASMVVASARHPPFGLGSFDGIVHTDVLC